MKLVQIWRYPIKSHGSENLETIDILNGKTLPLDRNWAVIHDQSEADGLTWVPVSYTHLTLPTILLV